MNEISLHSTSGNAQADRILQGIVGVYEAVFPGLVAGYYVIGSYADASSVPISDIDIVIVFGTALSNAQFGQMNALAQHCAAISPLRLDMLFALRGELSGTERTLLKIGSRCVYGRDLRDTLELPPIGEYQRDVTWSPYRFLGQILRGQELLHYPLNYPDGADRFFGYTQKRIPEWYPAGVERGTKELISGVTRTATALLALRARQYVASKGGSVRAYREHIGDAWSDYLEMLYRKGKIEWQYAIPPNSADQELLHELCEQTLAFENHYFWQYRAFLLECLHGATTDRLFAAQRLTQVVFHDAAIAEALTANAASEDAALREAAMQALTFASQSASI